MTKNELYLRVIENKDWVTILFVFVFALLAITKSMFESRFADFMKLFYSKKYLSVYKENSNLKSIFTILLFLIQITSLAFFIQLSLHYHNDYFTTKIEKTDWVIYIRILTFLGTFIVGKFLIEKIIATAFDIEDFTDHFNLQKITFRNYICLFLIPINIVLFYYNSFSLIIIKASLIAFLFFILLTYVLSLRNYQYLIIRKLFYFILYLCVLEIAPYYFMFYCLKKGLAKM